MNQILVDTSVWINYFSNKNMHRPLDDLIKNDYICTNQIIFSELIPSLIHKNEIKLLNLIKNINDVPLNIDWVTIRDYQIFNLKNGINGVALIDLIILDAVITNRLIIYSTDKHFLKMSALFNFELFNEEKWEK